MGQIVFTRSNRGIGRKNPSKDAISALIGHGYEIVDGVEFDTNYKFVRIDEAEDIGITLENDIANDMLVWYHIDEFFRINPGVELHLRVVSDAVTAPEIVDKDADHLKKLLRDTAGVIKRAGVFLNVVSGETADGLDEDVWTAIAVAQQLADYERSLNRPIHIYIEGRGLAGNTTDVGDARAQLCGQVSLVIAQDLDIAALDASFTTHAAVGTVVGIKAFQKVNDNIGYVGGANIQSKADGRWVRPGLSSNLALTEYDDDPTDGDFKTLGDKGFIFPMAYMEQDGVFFNDDPTCDAIDSDFYCCANSETYNKAHRALYKALLPKVNSTTLVDPDTGKLAASVCQEYEEIGETALFEMQKAGEISGKKVFCDPDQNVLLTSEVLDEFEIVPTGTARKVGGSIKFVKKVSR